MPVPNHSAADVLKSILNARVYDVAEETDLQPARLLSSRLHNKIFLKREDQQPIFCYKLRGAYNKMRQLSSSQLKQGVIVASAGNHAQGVAMSAQKLGCKSTIVMPVTTPEVKVEAVKRWGAKVVLNGDSFDEAYHHALEIQAREDLVFVHPFDDLDIIAGQGTVGQEILRQHTGGKIHSIFLPIGGGGLIAGVAAYVKQLQPEIRIIGVEPDESDAMRRSLQAGRRVKLKEVGIFADGVAVKQVGKHTFKLCQQFVDEVVTVSTDEICAAIKDICEDSRTLVEPSGALALAGVKHWLREKRKAGTLVSNQNIVAICSGANMNFDRLRHVSERAEIGQRREAILAVTIPERPGSYRQFINILGKRSVSEFSYRHSNSSDAHIFVGVQISTRQEVNKLVQKLMSKGYPTLDLTDNEMAKIHARHLVGGRAHGLENERLLSFEFPERPGALKNFLDQIGTTWNITLFHYRNHGSDFGRVLCGIQVPPDMNKQFKQFLKQLGYRHKDETDNPIYKLFLS